jgi:hypothetical protein
MPAAGNGGYGAIYAPACMMNRADLMTNDTGLGNATPGRRLSCVPLLSSLDESSLAAFEAEFEWVSVPGGRQLGRCPQVGRARGGQSRHASATPSLISFGKRDLPHVLSGTKL